MSITFSTKALLPFIVGLSALTNLGQAFVIPGTTHCSTQQRHHEKVISDLNVSPREPFSVSLYAGKRRRRRKNTAKSPPSSEQQESIETPVSVPETLSMDSNELPDFDLGGDEQEEEKRKPKINSNEITANMMGSGMTSARSLDELISDRALESKFEFDEKGDLSIPDFVDLARASSTTPTYDPDSSLSSAGIGKKKQRQAERIARAVAAKEAEEPEGSFLADYFPQLLDEKGNFSAVKLLEQGGKFGDLQIC
jgi:hypothetical protein